MTPQSPVVLSASRRTDIPAFYMPGFMASIERGYFDVENPFNKRIYRVDTHPRAVHSVVFWSKNYGPFLSAAYDRRLQAMGFNLLFHFTLNSSQPYLEPAVPPLDIRLKQLEQLCRRHDPRAVIWRFDPICHFQDPSRPTEHLLNNLHDFSTIAEATADLGIRRCVTSFFDDYAKVRRRTRVAPHVRFVDPPLAKKIEILTDLERTLAGTGITLYTCCEGVLMERLPVSSRIQKSACIPHDLLVELFGGWLPGTADRGQRRQLGCGCHISRDIGSYRLQPCRHNCLYCYASPAADAAGASRSPC